MTPEEILAAEVLDGPVGRFLSATDEARSAFVGEVARSLVETFGLVARLREALRKAASDLENAECGEGFVVVHLPEIANDLRRAADLIGVDRD